MAEEVRINLTSSADTAGIDKMGAAVGGLSGGAAKAAAGLGDAGKSAKEMGQGLGKAVEVGGATTALMQNIASASQGGAQGMFAAGRAILSFGQIVKGVLLGAGPVGIAIAALGLLAGAALALKDAFKPAGESVEEFKKRIENLDKANLRALEATVSSLSDRLKNAREEADAVRASLDKIDDAEMAAQLAAVKASNLKPEQKEQQDFLIRDEFKKRRENRQRDALSETAGGARETLGALAPEFEDARQKYADLLTEADRYRQLERERDNLKREISGFNSDGRSNFDYGKANRIQQIERTLPGSSEREKFDADLASARDRFQGSDGKGGIASRFQDALKDSEKSERALARFNDELKRVREWDSARVRIENGGTDPREIEAAARRSPGRNRTVGPDGRVNEFESAAAPTINQQIAATANAMRLGGGALQMTQPGAGNQAGFGALQPGAVDTRNQVTRGPLQPGSDNTGNGITGAAGLKPAADKVADAAGKSDEASKGAQDQLAKIGDGAAKLAENTSQLTTGITTAATGLGSANEQLASAISAATGDLAATMTQAVTLGDQNVAAYTQLSSEVRSLKQQVATALSQLSAARSRK